MRILFYHSCGFSKLSLGVLLDEAEKMYREGNEIYFLTCSKGLQLCMSNFQGNKGLCNVCKFVTDRTLLKLSSGIIQLNLKDYVVSKRMKGEWTYSSASDIKKIIYRNVEIGYATLSSYITLTRNHLPKIDIESRKYFDNSLDQGMILTDAIYELIDIIRPDKVCLFNGRLNETRSVYQVAKVQNITVTLYEVVGGINGPFYKIKYDNYLPHDIAINEFLIKETWEKALESDAVKNDIGKSFYQKKRQGVVTNDKVYTKNQQKGLLPINWNDSKNNVVIFNSSEDEFAAIGDEYDKLSFFPSQLEGIETILKLCESNQEIHFYLRIHPNLANVKYKYHCELYKLPLRHTNITVISPEDKTSTYDLMDAANKIIVFGSTMGLESVYWRKAVILLAGALYYNFDLTYKPKDLLELKKLIENDITSKYNDDVLKIGFYLLSTSAKTIDKQQFSYFDINLYPLSFFGRKFFGVNYQKFFGSKYLFIVLVTLARIFALVLYRNRYRLPLAEE